MIVTGRSYTSNPASILEEADINHIVPCLIISHQFESKLTSVSKELIGVVLTQCRLSMETCHPQIVVLLVSEGHAPDLEDGVGLIRLHVRDEASERRG